MSAMFSLPRFRRTLLVLAASTALALSGCGEDEPDPSASSSPSASEHSDHEETDEPSESPSEEPSKSEDSGESVATVDVTIKGDEVTPIGEAVEIGVGEKVVLNIDSDRSGELHVHSSPEKELEFPAGTSKLDVMLDQPGSVDIEEHESGALIVRVLVR